MDHKIRGREGRNRHAIRESGPSKGAISSVTSSGHFSGSKLIFLEENRTIFSLFLHEYLPKKVFAADPVQIY